MAIEQFKREFSGKQKTAVDRLLADVSTLTYSDIIIYIDNNVTDLASAKVVLKRYGKVILALVNYLNIK